MWFGVQKIYFFHQGWEDVKAEKQISRELRENATLKFRGSLPLLPQLVFISVLHFSTGNVLSEIVVCGFVRGAKKGRFRLSDLISCQHATTKCREIVLIKRIVDTYWTRRCKLLATFYTGGVLFYFIYFLEVWKRMKI